MLSSEIDLLMYSTFAVQSDESARQQCLTFVLPYVLLWSNRAVIHLANDDSRDDPAAISTHRKDPAGSDRSAGIGTTLDLTHQSFVSLATPNPRR